MKINKNKLYSGIFKSLMTLSVMFGLTMHDTHISGMLSPVYATSDAAAISAFDNGSTDKFDFMRPHVHSEDSTSITTLRDRPKDVLFIKKEVEDTPKTRERIRCVNGICYIEGIEKVS